MKKTTLRMIVALTALFLANLVGCSDNTPAGLAPFPTSNQVFLDEFGPFVTFEAFLGSKLDALDIDATASQAGTRSLVITVPNFGDPSGSYAGGALTTTVARDLSGYNALTFWAKASTTATIDVVGLGNDNTGTSRFTAEVNDLPVTTSWTKFVIPIPLPNKLVSERGLFYFAEGPENGSGYTLWFDEIQFETLGTISNPEPTIPTITIDAEVTDTITLDNGSVTFDVNGTPLTVSAMPGNFTYVSSDQSVIDVAGNGVISAVGIGSTELTANLGTVPASGTITVNVEAALAVPAVPAPTPSQDPADVVSIYSEVFTSAAIDTWSADWDEADVEDYVIGSDTTKLYTNLSFAGIEFTTTTIDATAMTYFHMDVWTPNSTSAPATFKFKLIDFGANGTFGGGDDAEHELTFNESTMNTGSWVSIDVPLSAFSGLTARGHLAQLIISGDLSTVYVDNIYLYFAEVPTAPSVPAPIPSVDAGSVVSLLSDVYTNVSVDSWSAVWDNATVEDYFIGSDVTKKYTNLVFAGIDFRTNTVDASTLTHFHLDVWTPDPTAAPSVFKIKLIDFGANGVSGGGDDVEDELVFDASVMASFSWVSIDVPLSSFSDLTTQAHLAQMIISGDLSTVYVDNVYFYDSGIPAAPTDPAPTPTLDPANVISLFSDAYSNVTVDTWSAVWDSADVVDYVIGSDSTKRYTNLLFAGIEFTTSTIDASAMTHFHMDLWTPDPTAAPSVFKIKLVDFGPNGIGENTGGDDAEHEITLDENTMNTGSWVSISVALSEFTGLTTKGHLGQLIISGVPNTVFMDNIYLHK